MALPTYAPNVNNAPLGLANANAPGSPYAAAYSRGVTTHLNLPVDPKIFDAQPQQFLDLQFLMAFASEDHPGDEVIWHENVWGRTSPVVRDTFVGVSASPGVTVTGTLPITAASLPYVYPDQKITYNGTQATVMSVTSTSGSEAIVIRSLVGVALNAAAAGDYVTNGMTQGSDGGEYFAQPTYTTTIQRSNLMEKIGPESRIWNHLERIKWKNLERTDYMQTDIRNRLTQLKVSICQRLWFGQYGESLSSQGNIFKTTGGIVPTIQANGGATLTSTMSTVMDDIRTGIFQTNFMALDNERVVFGTPEMLDAINLKQWAEFVRYPDHGESTYGMSFEQWKFGGQILTLIPTQIWGDAASFPPEYARRLVVLQKQNIKITGMRGVPMMEQELVTQSRSNITPTSIYDYERYYCQGFIGSKTMNPAACFIVDVAE